MKSEEWAGFWLKVQPARMRRNQLERWPIPPPTPAHHKSERRPILSTPNSSRITADFSDSQLEFSRFQLIPAGWSCSNIQPAGIRRSDSSRLSFEKQTLAGWNAEESAGAPADSDSNMPKSEGPITACVAGTQAQLLFGSSQPDKTLLNYRSCYNCVEMVRSFR